MDTNQRGNSNNRDVWSDAETEFFVKQYKLLENEVGKHKRFQSRKNLFAWIANEMATKIQSKKDKQQLSSHYYALIRKSKKLSTDKRVNMIEMFVFDTKSVAETNEASSLADISTLVIDELIFDMNGELIPGASDINQPTIDINNINESIVVPRNEPIHANKATGLLLPINGICVDDGDDSLVLDVNRELIDDTGDINRTTNVNINTIHESVVVPRNEPIHADKTTGVGLLSTFDRNYGNLIRFGPRPSRIENVSIACISGNSANGNIERPTVRIAGIVNPAASSSSAGTRADVSSSTSIAQSSSSSRSCLSPSCQITSNNTPSRSSQPTGLSGNTLEAWTTDQTKWLLDQYYYYIDEVGPMKLYQTRKDMWEHLAIVMNDLFNSNKTHDQLSKRVAAIITQKKNAVVRNRTSGASRMEVEFEDEMNKIAGVDDSIEPEVLRGVGKVQYKEGSKKHGESQPKKPRWDKPNKKGILNTLSKTMLSIETRRIGRDKAKEERNQKMHELMMEVLRSAKRY